MADRTHIEWTDATWNPITGCSVVSPGCTNCYAMRLAGGRLRHLPSRAGLTAPSKAGPVWTGEVRLDEAALDQPLRWRRPRKIFVCAHGDLFHEAVPDAWIDKVFAVMALAPQHVFQVLTKRSARMRAYLTADDAFVRWSRATTDAMLLAAPNIHPEEKARSWFAAGAIPNLWLGVSVEDQARADERIPDLLATPAAIRFVSAEPLLGPLSPFYECANCFRGRTKVTGHFFDEACPACNGTGIEQPAIDWVIAGGESGPGARPMHPAWARSLRDQCQAAGVPFFWKQCGDWQEGSDFAHPGREHRIVYSDGRSGPFTEDYARSQNRDGRHTGFDPEVMARVGKRAAGRLLDGRTWDEMPETAR